MGLLKGPLTARRYLVDAQPASGMYELVARGLGAHAFRQPASSVSKEQVWGWVRHDNLLETDFEDRDRWLWGDHALFALRVDRKSVPAALLRAHVDRAVRQWCAGHGREKAPRSVRDELRDAVEEDLLRRTLPSVRVFEVAWSLSQGRVLFGSLAEAPNDLFRKHFHRGFGLRLLAEAPVEWLEDDVLATSLELTGASDLSVGGGAPEPADG